MAATDPESINHGEGDRRPIDDLADPLPIWVRAVSLLLGVVALSLGSCAVFVTDNHVGSAALLLVSIVLLLLGLQGAPLISLGGGEYRIELARIRQRAVEVLDGTARSESPEVAAAVVEAVTAIEPAAAGVWKSAHIYEQAVLQAVIRTGAAMVCSDQKGTSDGVMRVQYRNVIVNIVVEYRASGDLLLRDVKEAVARLKASGFDGGHLFITNAPSALAAKAYNLRNWPQLGVVRILTWTDERDDGALELALADGARWSRRGGGPTKGPR